MKQDFKQQALLQQQLVSEFNELEEVAVPPEIMKKPSAKIVNPVAGVDQAASPQKPKEAAAQQPKRKKMRDVTQAKKLAYYEATNRVINAKTARRSDLMLCVKES